MNLLKKLLAIFGWGFVLHQTAPLLDVLPSGWMELTSYGIGIIGAFPAGVWVNREFKQLDDDHRFAAAFISLFFSFGAGVAFGYLFNTIIATLFKKE